MTNKKPIIIWLFSGCVLIFILVVIGGITRLTDSGLSMVNWNLFMGAVPPLNESDWQETFNLYKQSPEFKKINFNYGLEDFKYIFFWEYLHRMTARLLGLVFIIPFLYFLFKKWLNKKLILQSVILFIMGALQAFFGWWMVKSGLVDRPDVSHYRLAIHLITAFLTCSYTLWVALSIALPSFGKENKKTFINFSILLVLVIIQIIYGAFVAGLKAGKIYTTWPKMGGEWVPESVFLNPGSQAQFIHRILALIIMLFTIYIWKKTRDIRLIKTQHTMVNVVLLVVLIQAVVGILTLIMSVPIALALTHQIFAFVLLMSIVFCLFLFKPKIKTCQ